MQLLIIGASGFIGRHLYQYCKQAGICAAGTYYQNKTDNEYIFFDMYRQSFADLLERMPENFCLKEMTVILCGANASIDSCKLNEKLSYILNVQRTKEILAELQQLKIKTVFLSSEAVFEGEKGLYTEEDIPNPITAYGRQKFEIENYILGNIKNALIFRISRAVGSCFGEKDIFNEFFQKICKNEKIICLKNQSFCLTEVDDISKAIVLAVSRDLQGLYHVSSDNYITRYELARLFSKEVFNGRGLGLVEEKDFEEINFVDNRHVKGGLNGALLKKYINMEYMDLNTIIRKYKKTIPAD